VTQTYRSSYVADLPKVYASTNIFVLIRLKHDESVPRDTRRQLG